MIHLYDNLNLERSLFSFGIMKKMKRRIWRVDEERWRKKMLFGLQNNVRARSDTLDRKTFWFVLKVKKTEYINTKRMFIYD